MPDGGMLGAYSVFGLCLCGSIIGSVLYATRDRAIPYAVAHLGRQEDHLVKEVAKMRQEKTKMHQELMKALKNK